MSPVQLDIIVVGGGIGGLSTALALRRAGHTVTVLESSSWLREAGAAVAVPPNATRALMGLGIDLRRDAKAARLKASKEYHFARDSGPPKFGKHGDGRDLPWGVGSQALGIQHLFFLAHRVDLHDALKVKCTNAEGPGTPVRVLLSSRVVAWNAAGTVRLHTGSEMQADLVIAADGVHSCAHEAILGYSVPAMPGGITAIRFVLNTADILNDPVTASIMDDGPGCFTYYMNADRTSYLLRYPCHKSVPASGQCKLKHR
jgi:salicylate hydroxylase